MMLALMATVGKDVGYENSIDTTLKPRLIRQLSRQTAVIDQMLAKLAIKNRFKYLPSWKMGNHNLPPCSPKKPDFLISIKENPEFYASWIGLKFIDKKTSVSQHCQQLLKYTASTWLKDVYEYYLHAYISANIYLHMPTEEGSCLFSL